MLPFPFLTAVWAIIYKVSSMFICLAKYKNINLTHSIVDWYPLLVKCSVWKIAGRISNTPLTLMTNGFCFQGTEGVMNKVHVDVRQEFHSRRVSNLKWQANHISWTLMFEFYCLKMGEMYQMGIFKKLTVSLWPQKIAKEFFEFLLSWL